MAERMAGISGVIVDVGEVVGVGVIDGVEVVLGSGVADGGGVELGAGEAVGGIGLAVQVGGICARIAAVGDGDHTSGEVTPQANKNKAVMIEVNKMKFIRRNFMLISPRYSGKDCPPLLYRFLRLSEANALVRDRTQLPPPKPAEQSA